MKYKRTLLFGVLGILSLAAYGFLFHAQGMTEPAEVIDAFSESIRYNNDPVASPDVQLLKGILKAIANLLPAS